MPASSQAAMIVVSGILLLALSASAPGDDVRIAIVTNARLRAAPTTQAEAFRELALGTERSMLETRTTAGEIVALVQRAHEQFREHDGGRRHRMVPGQKRRLGAPGAPFQESIPPDRASPFEVIPPARPVPGRTTADSNRNIWYGDFAETQYFALVQLRFQLISLGLQQAGLA